jgi:hypothetical protein
MEATHKQDMTFRVFVSRPYDEETNPTKYWKSLYTKGIKPVSEIVKQRSLYCIELYDASLERDPLQIDVKVAKALDTSDIFLCVLTDYRSCVLYEAGYAKKLGLPAVYMLSRKHWNQHIPILVGIPDTLYYDHDESDFDTIPNMLADYLVKACQAAELLRRRSRERFREPVYQVTCYKNRSHLEFPRLIKSAKSEIGILTTNIDYFVNPDDLTFEEEPFNIQCFADALSSGVRIDVLTMDPDCNLVIERSKQIAPHFEQDVYVYREELRRAILQFYKAFREPIQKGKLGLRLFDSLPTVMLYIIDNKVYVPSMVGHKRSRHCVHVQFEKDYPGVRETFLEHYDLVKRKAKPIDLFSWVRESVPERSDSSTWRRGLEASASADLDLNRPLSDL